MEQAFRTFKPFQPGSCPQKDFFSDLVGVAVTAA